MAGIAVTDAAPGSAEWLRERNNGIGASEVATLLGLNPYNNTVLDLWLAKTGQAESFAGNYASRRGQHMEPFVLAAFAEEHPGMNIDTPPRHCPSIIRHPDVAAARFSPDALGQDRHADYVIEIKTANSRQVSKWADGNMPDAYKAQVGYQLAITGLDQAYVAADVAGHYEERIVTADAGFSEQVLELVDNWWWDHIDPNGPKKIPDPDAVRDRDILPKLWKADVTLEPVVLPSFMVQRLKDTKAALAAAKTDYAVACAEVQVALGEAVAGVDAAGDQVCTWGPVKGRSTVDRKALADDGLLDKYSVTGESGRAFRVK